MKKIILATVLILYSILAAQSQKKEEPKTSVVKEKKENKENLLIKLQDGAKPKIIVDGKVFDFPIELIDQSKIETVFVVKGKEAINKYDAPNGVVLITTKQAKQLDFSNIDIKQQPNIENKNGPKIILDGKVVNRKILDTLSSSKIERINVVKGDKAKEEYDAPNGVILITTKKNK